MAANTLHAQQNDQPAPRPALRVVGGCEGEGCDCIIKDTPADASFALYADTDKASEKLGEYQAGAKAEFLGSFMKIFSEGKYEVTTVRNDTIGAKVGDILTNVYGQGEGYSTATIGDKSISFYFEDLEMKELSPLDYEQWYKIKVGEKVGYSTILPFQGCLE